MYGSVVVSLPWKWKSTVVSYGTIRMKIRLRLIFHSPLFPIWRGAERREVSGGIRWFEFPLDRSRNVPSAGNLAPSAKLRIDRILLSFLPCWSLVQEGWFVVHSFVETEFDLFIFFFSISLPISPFVQFYVIVRLEKILPERKQTVESKFNHKSTWVRFIFFQFLGTLWKHRYLSPIIIFYIVRLKILPLTNSR